MEKKILLINARKIHSKKTDKDYYVIEYIDKEYNLTKTLVKNIKEMDENIFNKFKSKIKTGEATECIGIYEINKYDKAELKDIK